MFFGSFIWTARALHGQYQYHSIVNQKLMPPINGPCLLNPTFLFVYL